MHRVVFVGFRTCIGERMGVGFWIIGFGGSMLSSDSAFKVLRFCFFMVAKMKFLCIN